MEPRGLMYDDLKLYSSQVLESGVAQSATLCHDDLCCQLNYKISCSENEPCDKYRLLSYSGHRTIVGTFTFYIQV